jgi:hypothetical protein
VKTGKEAGIAKVLYSEETVSSRGEQRSLDRRRAGMGALVAPRRVVTCAHVVNAALGLDEKRTRPPAQPVEIVFPLSADPTAIFKATVKKWFPVNHPKTPDVAVLELDRDAPSDAGITIFGIIRSRLDGDTLSVYGGFKNHDAEDHVSAKFVATTGARDQLISAVRNDNPGQRPALATKPYKIGEGFSGAAIWDVSRDVAIGIVTRDNETAEEIFYMSPTANLVEAWPDFPTEVRRLPRLVEAIWNALALILFTAMFYFMIMKRTAVEGQEDLLSPFWGLHVYAFLAPLVGCFWFMYARDFRLHGWSSRAPRFLAIPFERESLAAKISVALTLLLFVVSLFWIEGHFTRVFYDRGKVYFYPEQFGYNPKDLNGCITRDTPLCPLPVDGRFSLVTPRPPATGGYWDNAYHYGGDKNGTTVTFFPILQPLVLQGLALFAVFVQLAALARTFGRGDWLIVPFARLAFWRTRHAGTVDAGGSSEPKP